MSRVPKGAAKTTILIGIVIGIVVWLGAEKAYHYSSTDTFCSSCHSMAAYVSSDPRYVNSAHRSTATGIQVGCSDCHVPPSFPANLIYKTKSGIKDIYEEWTNDFTKPETWEARRADLAHGVRDWFVANDSAPCQACHTPEKLRPKRESGQRQHELAKRENISCIGCHFNLVHQTVKPTKKFADYGRVRADMTHVANK